MTRRSIMLAVASLALAMGVQAGERGSLAEAKAMLDKAVAHYKAAGRKQALADFNGKKAPLKDASGKALGKSLMDAGARAGGGSVEYPHINPVSRKPEPKVSFVQKVGEDVCGVGAYKG